MVKKRRMKINLKIMSRLIMNTEKLMHKLKLKTLWVVLLNHQKKILKLLIYRST